MALKKGFYTALGTPLDKEGNLIAESLEKHIEQQIAAGASGLLLLGSMGIEAYVKNCAYADIVRVGIAANAGRLPFFVGVMDNSIAKVMEKEPKSIDNALQRIRKKLKTVLAIKTDL